MGCDIHIVIERKVDNKWLGIFSSDFSKDSFKIPSLRRHYEFFTMLAGVRAEEEDIEIGNPKGLPISFSHLTQYLMESDEYPEGDSHSHSHMNFREFCDCFSFFLKKCGLDKMDDYEILGDYKDDDRVIIYFDN